jgi:hypothetical protein
MGTNPGTNPSSQRLPGSLRGRLGQDWATRRRATQPSAGRGHAHEGALSSAPVPAPPPKPTDVVPG